MKLQGIHYNLLLKAVDLAKQSKMIQKHGAVMFHQNHIYSNGINSCNRSRIMGKDFPSIHAEIDCIARKLGQSKKCLLSKKTKSKIQHIGCTCKSFRRIGRLEAMYHVYSCNERKRHK
jgi:hypothetical protein